MEDMWRFRDKPVPLDFDLIQSDQFVLRGQAVNAVDPSSTDGILRPVNGDSSVDMRLNGSIANRKSSSASSTPKGSAAKSSHGLKDQRSLSLHENLALFVSRLASSLFPPRVVHLCNLFKARSVSQRASCREKRRPYRLTRTMTIRSISSPPRQICDRQLTELQGRADGKSKVRTTTSRFWQVDKHVRVFRNGWKHHTRDCNNQCNHLGFDCAAGLAPVASSFRFLAERTCAIQTFRTPERH